MKRIVFFLPLLMAGCVCSPSSGVVKGIWELITSMFSKSITFWLIVGALLAGGCSAERSNKKLIEQTQEIQGNYQSDDMNVTGVVVLDPTVTWGTGLVNGSRAIIIVQGKGKGSVGGAADRNANQQIDGKFTIDTLDPTPTQPAKE